jgi:hypothetical protein
MTHIAGGAATRQLPIHLTDHQLEAVPKAIFHIAKHGRNGYEVKVIITANYRSIGSPVTMLNATTTYIHIFAYTPTYVYMYIYIHMYTYIYIFQHV